MRSGKFTKESVSYGAPLGFVHPADNLMPPQFVSELMDSALALTDAQRLDLQDRIDDLYGTLRGERDYL